MVRFSDIISKDPRGKTGELALVDRRRSEKFRMSDLPIIDDATGQDLPEPIPGDESGGKVKEYYRALLEKALELRERVMKDQDIAHSPVLTVLHEIIEADLLDELYEHAISSDNENTLPAHSVFVTIASLRLGRGMGYDIEQLLRLGLAAFFENVGMYKIPERILQKKEKLDSSEVALLRKHPKMSAEILSQLGATLEWLKDVALQVHERLDGSGYPNGLKGQEISEYAAVIGIMDTYMALMEKKPYRNRYVQTEAVKAVLKTGKGRFSPRVLKEFLNQTSLLPVSTYVRLNNQSIARVASVEKGHPLRPVVEVLYDGLGRKMTKGKLVRLAETPLLHIVDTIDESKLGDKAL